jgi:hypothetical protein
MTTLLASVVILWGGAIPQQPARVALTDDDFALRKISIQLKDRSPAVPALGLEFDPEAKQFRVTTPAGDKLDIPASKVRSITFERKLWAATGERTPVQAPLGVVEAHDGPELKVELAIDQLAIEASTLMVSDPRAIQASADGTLEINRLQCLKACKTVQLTLQPVKYVKSQPTGPSDPAGRGKGMQ